MLHSTGTHLGARHLGTDIWAREHLGAVPFGREIRANAFLINFSLVVFKINKNYFVSATILSSIHLIFCLQRSFERKDKDIYFAVLYCFALDPSLRLLDN